MMLCAKPGCHKLYGHLSPHDTTPVTATVVNRFEVRAGTTAGSIREALTSVDPEAELIDVSVERESLGDPESPIRAWGATSMTFEREVSE